MQLAELYSRAMPPQPWHEGDTIPDPFCIAARTRYMLALIEVSLVGSAWPAVLFACGVLLLSGIAVLATRPQPPMPREIVQPRSDFAACCKHVRPSVSAPSGAGC